MSLVAYTPFQKSIIHAVESAEASSKLLQDDLETFERDQAEVYGVKTTKWKNDFIKYPEWKSDQKRYLDYATKTMRELALKFTPFPQATQDQQNEVLRLLKVPPNIQGFPKGIQQIIDDYTGLSKISKLGDITASVFDQILEDQELLDRITKSREGLAKPLKACDMSTVKGVLTAIYESPNSWSLYERVSEYSKQQMRELALSIFPSEMEPIDALKSEMLLANLKAYNESLKSSSVKIEEITPDG